MLGAVGSAAFESAEPAAFLARRRRSCSPASCRARVGYTLQIIAQRYTPPAEAALILSLESVFAALAGAIWLGERLTAAGAVGCALILLGAVAAEAAPALAARRPRASERDNLPRRQTRR